VTFNFGASGYQKREIVLADGSSRVRKTAEPARSAIRRVYHVITVRASDPAKAIPIVKLLTTVQWQSLKIFVCFHVSIS